jgi:hypothetical protein
MFENTGSLVQQHMTMGSVIVGIIVLVIAWVIFLMIRAFWCWFWKTTHLVIGLYKIFQCVDRACDIGCECREQLKAANAALERLNERVSATAGNRQGESGGNRAA